MIISAQTLASYLGQDYSLWPVPTRNRATTHINMAGHEVRGALAMLYEIPSYTRDANGAITNPTGLTADPSNSPLGPIVCMLAAAFMLDPARGIQPQEDRSASEEYRISARAQLKALANKTAFLGTLAGLEAMGITPTAELIAALSKFSSRPVPALRQTTSPIYGKLKNPDEGADFDVIG